MTNDHLIIQGTRFYRECPAHSWLKIANGLLQKGEPMWDELLICFLFHYFDARRWCSECLAHQTKQRRQRDILWTGPHNTFNHKFYLCERCMGMVLSQIYFE
jgi:hypothetical protein